MNPRRNNVKAGLFVIAAIVLAAVTIVVLANSVEILGTTRYEVRFPLETGAPGLQTGSVVSLGGQPVGTVWTIGFVAGDGGADPDQVRVTIRIKEQVRLRDDAAVYLERPLLGAQSSLNITSLGGGPMLEAGGWVTGRLAPPPLLSQAGYGDEQARDLRTILDSTSTIAQHLESIITKFADEDIETIRATLEDARASAGRARQIADDVSGRYPAWADRVDDVMERAPEIAASLEDRLEQIRGILDRGERLIDENRSRIDESVENVRVMTDEARRLAGKLNDEGHAQVMALLEDGRRALDTANSTLERADVLLQEQSPNVRATLANARLAADQLRETMIEIRRTPWRLLFRPDTHELENELLYESARRYAGAVSDLRSVADALRAVAAIEGRSETYGASIEELLTLLQVSFDRYRSAEEAFLREIAAE